jgi:hypothetical protein
MHDNNTPQSSETQHQRCGTATNESTFSSFKPVTNLRVMLTPPVRDRIIRRFYKLQHSIRTIARGEQMPESVIERLARERYWDARRDDDTGPFPASRRRAA